MGLMNLWSRLFGRSKVVETPPLPERTPAQVEAFIDFAGRQAVFDRARSLGWSPSGALPPMWVWENIAAQIVAERGSPNVTIN